MLSFLFTLMETITMVQLIFVPIKNITLSRANSQGLQNKKMAMMYYRLIGTKQLVHPAKMLNQIALDTFPLWILIDVL